jgi:hypothetical protein
MEYIITIYRSAECDFPIAEIQWTGEFKRDPIKFARRHGGDYMTIEEREEIYSV